MTSDPPEPAPRLRLRAAAVALLFAVWFAATASLIEPLQAAMANWDQLGVDFSTLVLLLSPVGLAIAAVVGALAAVACAAAPLRGTAMLVALCVAAWLQADVFLVEYGTFDGTPLDWEAHGGVVWLEALAWLGLPALAALRPHFWARNALRILGVLVIVQGAGLAGVASDYSPFAPRVERANAVASNATTFAALSSRANAFVIVLDAAQSDYFAEAMQSESLAAAMPEGFVFYRNAISLYTSTQFSLQSMLTSRAVPDGKGAPRWLAKVMRGSLPVVLDSQGFDSKLVSFSPDNLSCTGQSDFECSRLAALGNLSAEEGYALMRRADVNLLFRLGAFRLAPHVLKPLVYDAGEWGLRAPYPPATGGASRKAATPGTRMDLIALERLTRKLSVEDVEPRFRFLHLNGAHAPARTRASCEGRTKGDLRQGNVETLRCVLSRLFGFFAALDAAGGYDPSLILIVADHGFPLGDVNPEVASPPLPSSDVAPSNVPFVARGVPMFLAKAPGGRGPMRVSDRPVSLCDIPASVVDALQLKTPAKFGCESIFTAKRQGERFHYRYPSYDAQKKSRRLNNYRFKFQLLRVEGHSWHSNSWRRVLAGRAAERGN